MTDAAAARRVIVVPCFDEAARLDVGALAALAAQADAHVLAVDDGSTDGTGDLLRAAARDHDRLAVLTLTANGGKAEAVRTGLRTAIDDGATVVGYFDADLATPVGEMARIVRRLDEDPGLAAVLGSRVALLGHHVVRDQRRHYLGRLFATASSAALGLAVYDTQCGAKAFRVTPALTAAVAEPFRSRWAFDVELLGRLRYGGTPTEALEELPLREWCDVGGSKLSPAAALGAGIDVVRLGWRWRRQAARRAASGQRGASNSATV